MYFERTKIIFNSIFKDSNVSKSRKKTGKKEYIKIYDCVKNYYKKNYFYWEFFKNSGNEL